MLLSDDSAGPDAGEALQISNVSPATHGTVTIATDGKALIFTPAANFSGTDTFTYTLSDGRGGTDTAQVTVTITEVNDVPTAGRDIRSMNEDTVLTLNVADLLGNDSAGAGETDQILTVISIGTASDGTAVLNGNTITYTPSQDFFGTIAFEYTIRDNGTTNGQADPKTAVGTVTINVNNVNDDPTAVNDTATAQTGAGSILIDVLSNDSSAPDSGETLTVTAVWTGSAEGTMLVAAMERFSIRQSRFLGNRDLYLYGQRRQRWEDTATVTVNVVNFVPGGISGTVFFNATGDLVENASSLTGVKVMLHGTDSLGNTVDLTTSTTSTGVLSSQKWLPAITRSRKASPNSRLTALISRCRTPEIRSSR